MGKPSFLASGTDDEGFTPEERTQMDAAPEAAADAAPEEQPEQTAEEQPEQAEKPVATKDAEKPEHSGDLGKALREERDRRRASDERAERLERTFQEVIKRMPQGAQPGQQPPSQQQQKTPAQQRQVPDFNQDPIGHLQAQLAQAMDQITELKGHSQQSTAQQQQQTQYNQFVDNYRAAVTTYSRTQADFGEAYNWLAQSALTEIEARYPGISPQEAQQIVNAEEERIVAHAFKSGRNPAEAVYNFAKARGFKKEPPAPPENKLARLAAGQKAASSLSGGKSAPNGQDNLSLEWLSTLQGDDFDKGWAMMEKKGLLG